MKTKVELVENITTKMKAQVIGFVDREFLSLGLVNKEKRKVIVAKCADDIAQTFSGEWKASTFKEYCISIDQFDKFDKKTSSDTYVNIFKDYADFMIKKVKENSSNHQESTEVTHFESDSDSETNEKKVLIENINDKTKNIKSKRALNKYSDEDHKEIRRMNSFAKLLSVNGKLSPAVAVCIFENKIHIGASSPINDDNYKTIKKLLEARIKWIQQALAELSDNKVLKKTDVEKYVTESFEKSKDVNIELFGSYILPKNSSYYSTVTQVIVESLCKILKCEEIRDPIIRANINFDSKHHDTDVHIYIGEPVDKSSTEKKEHDAQLIIDNLFDKLVSTNEKKLNIGVSILCCETCDKALSSWNDLGKIQIYYSGQIGMNYMTVKDMSIVWQEKMKKVIEVEIDNEDVLVPRTNFKKTSKNSPLVSNSFFDFKQINEKLLNETDLNINCKDNSTMKIENLITEGTQFSSN